MDHNISPKVGERERERKGEDRNEERKERWNERVPVRVSGSDIECGRVAWEGGVWSGLKE